MTYVPILRLKTCQISKTQILKYVNLPDKVQKAVPWDRLPVDLIGLYKIIREVRKDPFILKYLTMIDPVTQWF